MAGTRMAPCGSIRHVVASTRVKRAGSMAVSPLDVHDAGGRPSAVGILGDPQSSIGCPFRLAGRGMALDLDGLPPQRPFEVPVIDAHRKAPKQHFPDRHLIDDGVEPFDQKKFEVGRLTPDLDRDLRLDFRMGDDGGQSVSRLLEGLRRRRAPSLHADVGIVREMLPPGLALRRRGRIAHSLSLCLPSSSTVLAWGPLSPISSANVTWAPTARRSNAPSSTLLR